MPIGDVPGCHRCSGSASCRQQMPLSRLGGRGRAGPPAVQPRCPQCGHGAAVGGQACAASPGPPRCGTSLNVRNGNLYHLPRSVKVALECVVRHLGGTSHRHSWTHEVDECITDIPLRALVHRKIDEVVLTLEVKTVQLLHQHAARVCVGDVANHKGRDLVPLDLLAKLLPEVGLLRHALMAELPRKPAGPFRLGADSASVVVLRALGRVLTGRPRRGLVRVCVRFALVSAVQRDVGRAAHGFLLLAHLVKLVEEIPGGTFPTHEVVAHHFRGQCQLLPRHVVSIEDQVRHARGGIRDARRNVIRPLPPG
mmetsp:Transcript_19507/g.61919  ORF Transcript_19507/g.61919 Transcript_19507/m.61919 type:complete len:310 (-) Transcript_19507:232-1161(-)